jgi:peptidoglycan/xylan/chitin deacetylase (PgdA/CDA1 family)
MTGPRCLTVMYHYVRDRADTAESGIMGLNVADFESQLDNLCSSMRPIDWPTFTAWRAGHETLDEDAFLLTFDDGLSDHAEIVAPILESRGLRGVFFVQTGVLAGGVMDVAHSIHLLLCRMGTKALHRAATDWLRANLHDEQNWANDQDAAARAVYHYETQERANLKFLLTDRLPLDVREAMVSELFARVVGSSAACARHWYMGWEALGQLQSSGHTIGGHGHRHVPYVRIGGNDRFRDMQRCATVLAEGLGETDRPFSYPYGSFDDDVARRCASAGFVNGFTTQPNNIGVDTDAYRLGRVDTIYVDAQLERDFACQQV